MEIKLNKGKVIMMRPDKRRELIHKLCNKINKNITRTTKYKQSQSSLEKHEESEQANQGQP